MPLTVELYDADGNMLDSMVKMAKEAR